MRHPLSWQALMEESAASGRPVVVLFSLPGCGFCEQVRRDHLRHLARAPDSSGVIVTELDLSGRRPFNEGSTPAALAASVGVRVAPTVAFFGAGKELAPRLVGYQSPDFYGAYLDERIETATEALARSR